MTKIVILGGGFAGVHCALELERYRADLDVTLVSQDNFFLFTPLLHEVASGQVSMSCVTSPLRRLLRRTTVLQAYAAEIDFENKRVSARYGDELKHEVKLAYDHLVVALGSETNFFGIEGVEKYGFGMKTLGDALLLRNKLIANLEKANLEIDEGVRERRLTFLICGGGFAGVETAGAVYDFVRSASDFYKDVSADAVRVVLLHADEHLLPELGAKLGDYAERELRKRGVEIRLNSRIVDFDGEKASLKNGETIATDTLIWTAGTAMPPLVKRLDLKKAKGRLITDEYMRVAGRQNVWAIGDCAHVPDAATGQYSPGTAQHALRHGKQLARNIVDSVKGQPLHPFSYKTKGMMASIGSRSAVAQVFGFSIAGFPAWLLWRTFYWSQLPDLPRKARVGFSWLLDLIFHPDFVRFDTAGSVGKGSDEKDKPLREILDIAPEQKYRQSA